MSDPGDYSHMARALVLAENAVASADPNPAVGCVIVQGETIVGQGFTQPPGGNHAEIEALDAAGPSARGATVYVSLEPCSHTGRTGPCTEALIAAGVARVVYAVDDPNPDVLGRGASRLAEAGIAVEGAVLQAQAEALNRGYLHRHRYGRPWIRCKLAASLDGRTALANGNSQWITGAAARADVHRWRARASAVMTGIGTVLADDPSLNARPDESDRIVTQPLRVICDSHLQTPPSAKALKLAGDVIVFAAAGDATSDARRTALEAAGARVETVAGEGPIDLTAVVERLAELEVNTVLLEAGPVLSGAMLAAGLVDELILYLAPRLLGNTARGLFELPELQRLDDSVDLVIDEVRRVGDDLRIVASIRQD